MSTVACKIPEKSTVEGLNKYVCVYFPWVQVSSIRCNMLYNQRFNCVVLPLPYFTFVHTNTVFKYYFQYYTYSIPIQIKMFYRCYYSIYYNVIQISILYDFEFENVETKTNLKSSQRYFEWLDFELESFITKHFKNSIKNIYFIWKCGNKNTLETWNRHKDILND